LCEVLKRVQDEVYVVGNMSASSVDRVYETVKDMTVGFRIQPGSRINEVSLARELGASRTPLREALNRLVAENLLSFEKGRGFFCRALDAQEIADLYELRHVIEEAAVRRVARLQPIAELKKLMAFLDETGPEAGDREIEQLTRLDEHFHETLVALSGNAEMARTLRGVNERIRFIRWIDMKNRRRETQGEHHDLVEALIAGDEALAVARLGAHIGKRRDQIMDSVRESLARIYLQPGAAANRA
jgi:DNA-binding GntR family transcriptional regulator